MNIIKVYVLTPVPLELKVFLVSPSSSRSSPIPYYSPFNHINTAHCLYSLSNEIEVLVNINILILLIHIPLMIQETFLFRFYSRQDFT
jgi:hypothetical protein